MGLNFGTEGLMVLSILQSQQISFRTQKIDKILGMTDQLLIGLEDQRLLGLKDQQLLRLNDQSF